MHKQMPAGVDQLVLQIAFPDEATDAPTASAVAAPAVATAARARDTAGVVEGDGTSVSSAAPEPARPQTQGVSGRKWYSLYDKIFALKNLEAAWQHVQANGGAAGLDRLTIARFAEGAPTRLEHLSADLRAKTYPCGPRRIGRSRCAGC